MVARADQRPPSVFALALALFCVNAACGVETAARDAGRDVPPATDPRAAICSELEAGTSVVSYAVMQTIFDQNCVTCHSLGSDLNLQTGVSWPDLVNEPAPPAEACGGTLVVPGDPNASYLYQKLTNPSPCSGSQMPRTDLFPDPLPACVAALVASWITEGAVGPATNGAASDRRMPPGAYEGFVKDDDSVVTACAACGSLNRVLRARLRDDPTCGRCKERIFPRSPVTITDASWKKEVEDSPIPVLVDFWAPWCGPCRAVAPVLESLAAERAGKVKIAKLNVDENPQAAARFAVQAIPTMILFRGPLVVDQIRGAVPKQTIEAALNRAA